MHLRSIVLLLSLVIATPVAAQPADPGEAAYQEGRKAYDLREWDKAIEKFKEAYRIRSDGPSLFNIALSYRLKGDCVEATAFYKTYKRNFPTAPNLATVDKLLADLEPCAKERTSRPAVSKQPEPVKPDPQQPLVEPPKQVPIAQPQPQPIDTRQMPAPDDRGSGKKRLGMIVGIVGVAIVGTGFGFGLVARNKATDITNGGDPQNPPEFDASKEKTGKRFDLLAKVSWSVGGAAVIGGVVLYMMGRSASASESQVSITPSGDGAVVGWSQRF
jgi:hypothetical protein